MIIPTLNPGDTLTADHLEPIFNALYEMGARLAGMTIEEYKAYLKEYERLHPPLPYDDDYYDPYDQCDDD